MHQWFHRNILFLWKMKFLWIISWLISVLYFRQIFPSKMSIKYFYQIFPSNISVNIFLCNISVQYFHAIFECNIYFIYLRKSFNHFVSIDIFQSIHFYQPFPPNISIKNFNETMIFLKYFCLFYLESNHSQLFSIFNLNVNVFVSEEISITS